jgi:hypothetical protein
MESGMTVLDPEGRVLHDLVITPESFPVDYDALELLAGHIRGLRRQMMAHFLLEYFENVVAEILVSVCDDDNDEIHAYVRFEGDGTFYRHDIPEYRQGRDASPLSWDIENEIDLKLLLGALDEVDKSLTPENKEVFLGAVYRSQYAEYLAGHRQLELESAAPSPSPGSNPSRPRF